jgi:3-hydroxybutyryl-CoA dehydrogenase
MHFFNPVPAMKLVEIVRGMRTNDSTVAAVRTLAEKLGKSAIDVKDSPGFVVNRVLFPMINEAAFALQQGVAEPDGIDECMKLGCNHPLGPLALADLVGLDVVYAILDSLYREYGESRYAPCLEIKKRVEAGWLGRKTGHCPHRRRGWGPPGGRAVDRPGGPAGPTPRGSGPSRRGSRAGEGGAGLTRAEAHVSQLT